MPLVANFESNERKDSRQRAQASQALAKAFELVHRAVSEYENSKERFGEGIDLTLDRAMKQFFEAGDQYRQIRDTHLRLRRELRLDLPFSRALIGNGLFGVGVGRLGISEQQVILRTESELVEMAIFIREVSEQSLKLTGRSSDLMFERNFRASLVDLAQLHGFAVALSEGFAQSVAD